MPGHDNSIHPRNVSIKITDILVPGRQSKQENTVISLTTKAIKKRKSRFLQIQIVILVPKISVTFANWWPEIGGIGGEQLLGVSVFFNIDSYMYRPFKSFKIFHLFKILE